MQLRKLLPQIKSFNSGKWLLHSLHSAEPGLSDYCNLNIVESYIKDNQKMISVHFNINSKPKVLNLLLQKYPQILPLNYIYR